MSDDELDDRIRDALSGGPSAEHVARAKAVWRRMSTGERLRRRVRVTALAAAAALGAVACGSWLINKGGDGGVVERRDGPSDNEVVKSEIADATLDAVVARPSGEAEPKLAVNNDAIRRDIETDVDAGVLVTSRAPTAFERFVFVARTGAPAADDSGDSRQQSETIDAAIERLTGQADVDPAAVLRESGVAAGEAEGLLLARLGGGSEGRRHAIVRMLAVCGSARSLPALVGAGRHEAVRGEAAAAIERIAGVAGLAAVVRQTPGGPMRVALMERLLAAGSDEALREFLSLVSDRSLRGEALAAADNVSQPPIEPLLMLLVDEKKGVRVAAAMTLGRMNGPAVTHALIELVLGDQRAPSEAWVALLACRGESADRFLADAARHPRMLGHVNNARLFWARMDQ